MSPLNIGLTSRIGVPTFKTIEARDEYVDGWSSAFELLAEYLAKLNHAPGAIINPQRPSYRHQYPDFTSALGATADMATHAAGRVPAENEPRPA